MRYIVTLIIALYASPSFGADPLVSVFGMHQLSCGKYLKDVSSDPYTAAAYGWWIAGFISGTNLEKGRAISTDNPAHEAWLKQYCEKNPLDPFFTGAIELNKELDNKQLH
jgi:hypothetical protein